jgi:hypothetical protein
MERERARKRIRDPRGRRSCPRARPRRFLLPALLCGERCRQRPGASRGARWERGAPRRGMGNLQGHRGKPLRTGAGAFRSVARSRVAHALPLLAQMQDGRGRRWHAGRPWLSSNSRARSSLAETAPCRVWECAGKRSCLRRSSVASASAAAASTAASAEQKRDDPRRGRRRPDFRERRPAAPSGGKRANEAAFRRSARAGARSPWLMPTRGQIGFALGRALARPPGRMIARGPSG